MCNLANIESRCYRWLMTLGRSRCVLYLCCRVCVRRTRIYIRGHCRPHPNLCPCRGQTCVQTHTHIPVHRIVVSSRSDENALDAFEIHISLRCNTTLPIGNNLNTMYNVQNDVSKVKGGISFVTESSYSYNYRTNILIYLLIKWWIVFSDEIKSTVNLMIVMLEPFVSLCALLNNEQLKNLFQVCQ